MAHFAVGKNDNIQSFSMIHNQQHKDRIDCLGTIERHYYDWIRYDEYDKIMLRKIVCGLDKISK